ncbi:hypothetical protein Tco_1535556, partial [Tanacetum coccineum]
YHNLEDDVMIKGIFNSWKSKNVVGMKIPDWMITDEMKLTENYQLYPEVFGVDVPTTQSQPIDSTKGTHRTTNAPRTPNPKIAEGESSAPRRSTVIRLLEGSENVEVASSSLRNDDNQTNPITSPSVVRPRDQDDPHNDVHPVGENSAKRQKITEHGTFELGGSSFGQDYESEPGPSMSGNQEQSDDLC